MLEQEKSVIYTYNCGDGFYHEIKVYDNGLVECYIYHGKICLPMFMFAYHLSRSRPLQKVIGQVEKDSNKYKDFYRSYIKNSRIHYIKF